MYVVTADQVNSRNGADRVEPALKALKLQLGRQLLRAPARTIGDELQAVTADPGAALETILLLDRLGQWSIGCGIGRVDLPVPRATRAASGPAFIAAREAVEAAKHRTPRFALRLDEQSELDRSDVEPLLELLLVLRARRTEEGWRLYDLIIAGATQKAAAEQLRITPQAISQRARAAQLRIEADAKPALVRLLAQADVLSVATPS
jgi:hypothetical protein